jgi:hypothetical protein
MGNKTKKTIVYCRNIASCANLYEYFNQALGQTNILSERLVAMFHRSTADRNKDHVLSELVYHLLDIWYINPHSKGNCCKDNP